MKDETIVKRLIELRDSGHCVSETIVLDEAINFITKSKETILNLYTELLEAFNGDKAALKKVDTIFDKPLEEVNS